MGEIGMDETDSHWFGCCVFDAEQPICQGNNLGRGVVMMFLKSVFLRQKIRTGKKQIALQCTMRWRWQKFHGASSLLPTIDCIRKEILILFE